MEYTCMHVIRMHMHIRFLEPLLEILDMLALAISYDLRNSSLPLIHKQYSYNSDKLQNVEHDICFNAFKMLIAT